MGSTIENIKETLNSIVLDPQYADLLAIVKGFRNGLVYGTKVRLPHALVMVFLFRSGTLREKLALVWKATRQHARNLAYYVTIYKSVTLLLRSSNAGKERHFDTFLAGLVGGYYVFGRGIQSSVNQQIVIYVFARVVLGLAKISVVENITPNPDGIITNNAWPVFASLSWAFVMFLFRWHPEALQPSLRSSMKYLYSNADRWTDFRTFLIHNS